ncbi:hopanoid-associated sugar epimerase [Prochlorothrix hollandica]|uniref:Dihydroflavonol 4-reductase n=1 Tax=Prochlorothrix hollandica PCC 9006 = CALU 1027 TaxID=317619 RepID=A0A0M2PSG7_PROHO|nr:hopanoid-associated sugar epimerase [Prochlorothrix hollandica]KKI99069.1 dihydroflavonol 4-reductase [Prochlorothrix hollandica PCC 9006 = CALU 1027]
MGDRVFVTGGTGFVGANLVRLLLQEGYTVRALVRAGSDRHNLQGLDVELVEGDLNSPQLTTALAGCRYCFHTAAHYSLWQRDRAQLHQSNVLGTRNLLQSAQNAGIERTVYTSSVAAIGTPGTGQPVDETFQQAPEDLIGAYKQSKYWGEQEAKAAVQRDQDVVIVSPSTPVGAWDIKPTPTGDIIVRFLERRMPAYVNTGLNLIDVKDVAWGHLLALRKGNTGERYILGHQNLSLKEILDRLAQITGLPAPQTTVPLWLPLGVAWIQERLLAPVGFQPSVPMDGVKMSAKVMYYDASKAVTELGLPQSPIDAALRDAVQWFQARAHHRP